MIHILENLESLKLNYCCGSRKKNYFESFVDISGFWEIGLNYDFLQSVDLIIQLFYSDPCSISTFLNIIVNFLYLSLKILIRHLDTLEGGLYLFPPKTYILFICFTRLV